MTSIADLRSQVFGFIKQGNQRLLAKVLPEVKDLNYIIKLDDCGEHTPLLQAITLQKPKIAKLLIKSGADVNFPHESLSVYPPLGHAILSCSEKSLVPIVSLLLRHGANPNQVFHVHDAVRTPLHLAIRRRSLNLIDVLLVNGSNVELSLDTLYPPLFYALGIRNSGKIVNCLLKKGANPNLYIPAETGSFKHVTCFRFIRMASPLHFAISYMNIEKILVLLVHGADPNCIRDDCLSPLAYCLVLFFSSDDVIDLPRYMAIISLLLKHGADPNVRSWYNGCYLTPLGHYLRWTNCNVSLQLINLLFTHGAKVYLLDDHPYGILPMNLNQVESSILTLLVEQCQEYSPNLLRQLLVHYQQSECARLLASKANAVLTLRLLSMQKIRSCLRAHNLVYDQNVRKLGLPQVLCQQILGADPSSS